MIFSGESLLKELNSPWELILTNPVPEVVEFCSADWAEKYFSAQSGRMSSWVTLSPSYTKQFSSSRSTKLLGPYNGKIVVESFRKKYSTKPRKSQSVDMGLGTTILPSIFSADLSNVYCIVLYLMYAISTLLFLVVGKASRVPKVASPFSSIVE